MPNSQDKESIARRLTEEREEDDDEIESSAYSIENFSSPGYIALYCIGMHSIIRIASFTHSTVMDPTHVRKISTNLGTKTIFGGLCFGALGVGCYQLERLWEKWGPTEDQHLKKDSEQQPPSVEKDNDNFQQQEEKGVIESDKYFGRTQKSIAAKLRRSLSR
mmetsp:Transcript_16001/g.17794  ORF Transcript_16001/g.17794 Transcript_16001/m.17794 type:complete len:162 (-) Transcript_16001:329-814(-)